MALYFANTEITGVKDLFPLSSKDITGLYFADTELFTVWGEYDGTLPATYSANGYYLADYRIYGASGGVGDDSGTAYGYEVDMSVQSENLFDPSDTTLDYRYDDNGNWVNDHGVLSSGYMNVTAGGNYKYKFKAIVGKNIGVCRVNFLNASGQWLSVNKVSFNAAVGATVTVSGTAPAGTAFVRTSQYDGELNISMTVVADTTPIYIGDTPLGEDEYVDYGEQKVYRMVNGVLTPTDPPVPLPTLPTIDGTTITDYAGQSAAVPSRFVAKYRKEGFN